MRRERELGIIISDNRCLTLYMQFEVCRLVGPCKIRYARLCATTSESDRTFGKKHDARTTLHFDCNFRVYRRPR